jgi:hypothetical protein
MKNNGSVRGQLYDPRSAGAHARFCGLSDWVGYQDVGHLKSLAHSLRKACVMPDSSLTQHVVPIYLCRPWRHMQKSEFRYQRTLPNLCKITRKLRRTVVYRSSRARPGSVFGNERMQRVSRPPVRAAPWVDGPLLFRRPFVLVS